MDWVKKDNDNWLIIEKQRNIFVKISGSKYRGSRGDDVKQKL